MPTQNINLTSQMDVYVDRKIRSGKYANASEVMRAGLRALEEDEKEDQIKLKALRQALIAGEESGIAEDRVFDRIRTSARRKAAIKAYLG